MKVTRIKLERAPGLDKGLGEHHFEAGLNVVFGPNESGKSTLARAIQSTLWPSGRRAGVVIDVESDWDEAGVTWRARHDGDTSWLQGGEPAGGVGAEQGGEPGPLLPGVENADAYRLHLRDLIAGQDDKGDHFAARVREALDGGYDLTKRVTEERSRRFASTERRALKDARTALRKIEGERAELAQRQDDLSRLEAEQAAADRARVERALLERVEAWLDARGRLGEARAALEADPTPDLQGHEQRELAGLDAAIDACESDLEALELELDRGRRTLAELDVSGDVPDDAVLAGWLEDARELERLDARREDARAEVAEAAAAEAHARRALNVSVGDAVDPATPLFAPGLDDVEGLAQWLELRAAHATERRALEARRAQIERSDIDRSNGADTRFADLDADALAEARRIASLRMRTGPGIVAPFAGAVAAGSGVVWAAWQGVLVLPSWQLAAASLGAGLGGGAIGALLGRALARRSYVVSLEGLGLAREVASLDGADLIDAANAESAARDRDATDQRDLAALDVELQSLDARAPELEARRRELIDGFGIDPEVSDLTLTTWAHRVHDHARTTAALASAQTADASAAQRFERTRALLEERIAPFVPGLPTTPREGVGIVQALQKRVERAAGARIDIERGDERLVELGERRIEQARQRDELLDRLGLGALDGASARERLRLWLGGLEERRALQQGFGHATAVLAERAGALDGHDDLMALDAEEVGQRLARAREREAEADALSERIGAVKREVQIAEGEDRVEVALANVTEAERALETRRAEVFEGVAAKLLIDDVSEQIGTRHRPEVLTRATELFGLFTRHRYELEVATFGEHVRFVARDNTSAEHKQLDELSDGTRMQLLLAARLAFVHEGERGVHPPLVLDEALSSSDAARMTAMTDALVAEASTGRQIFYMTNDAGDVAFWRAACERAGVAPPHVVRLGEAERAANAASLEGFEPPVPIAHVPSPAGLDAKQYGMKLGVPLPDPWSETGELHLFHLLSDDLEGLHRVLDQGHVDRLGHFESRRRSGTAETLLGAEIVDRIVFRALVAERFFDAWKRGRGKRIRPSDFQACDGLTELYKDRLAGIVTDEGGDARVLMALIEAKDKRLSGLGKRREIVETFLQEQGFLSEDEPLAVDALVTDVSTGIGEALFGLGREEAHERLRDAESLVRHWARLLEPGDDAA